MEDVAEVYREITFQHGGVLQGNYGAVLGEESWAVDSLKGLARILWDHGLHNYRNAKEE